MKRQLNYLLIFQIFFLKSGVGQNTFLQKDKGTIVIDFMPTEKVFFYKPDCFQKNQLFDLTGTSTIESHISITVSQPFDVLYFSGEISEPLSPILVCSGDTIKIKKNKSKYYFYGNNQNELNILSLIEQRFGLTFATNIQFSQKTKFDFVFDEMQKKYDNKIQFMDTLVSNSIRKEWLKNELTNRYLIDLLMPYCGYYEMFNFENIPKSYTQKVDSICDNYFNKSPNLLSSSSGRTFLWTYNKFKGALKYKKILLNEWDKLYSISKNQPHTDSVKDYLCTRVLREWRLGSPVQDRDSIDFLLKQQPNLNCKILLEEELSKELSNINNIQINSLLKNSDRQNVRFDELLKDVGVLYLDFWASWCSPCRAEFPESKKLNEEYIKKGVSFVYISIDENFEEWDKATKQLRLLDSKSYLLADGEQSEILEQFKINSIPRYILIGKDGKVISADAPRPSDPKLRELFDELLKK